MRVRGVQGQEVCINYLGRGALRPVAERQADTASGYGFSCACPRCNFEQTYGAGVSQTLQGMSDQLGAKLGPQLNEAASSGDMAGVQQVKEQVTQLLVQLEAAITVAQQPAGAADGSSSGVHAFTAEQRTWLLASAFDMYALQGVACEVLGQEKEALESLSR